MELIGTGTFGKVYKTRNKHDKDFQVAIKVLNKETWANQLNFIVEEVNTLSEVDHPNLCRYFETYDDKRYIYLVMEYIKGK
mmetsp:Transcript_5876/g.7531  ORF Transcript_5876/g.7531 Transcript_5876/m.7531 type:complete len:81 (-) Transcript_5876:87-329(-)